MNRRRHLLLDRDGTIIVDKQYLATPDGVELLPGATEGLRRLTALDVGLIVVTNQSGIGRGYFDSAALERIHRRMEQLLLAAGVQLDGIFVCPHGPDEGCPCRKPRTGLVEQAVSALSLDPGSSFMIGDREADVELGKAVGATTLLVRTGLGAETEHEGRVRPDWIVDDLVEAAGVLERLLEEDSRRNR
jgi:D-glycero-D-manno-heptose 1,7-bisphosphate phosphatase